MPCGYIVHEDYNALEAISATGHLWQHWGKGVPGLYLDRGYMNTDWKNRGHFVETTFRGCHSRSHDGHLFPNASMEAI